jgi:hypothetical protein
MFFTAIAFLAKGMFEKDIYEINQMVLNCGRRA